MLSPKRKQASKRSAKKGRNNRVITVNQLPRNILTTGDVLPRSITVKLNYTDGTMLRTSGATFLAFRLRANSLFDVDPLLGSGTISGFTEIAALYRQYRVTHCEFEWTAVNNQLQPVVVGALFSNIDVPTVVTTNEQALGALENPFSTRAHCLSAGGGMDRVTLVGKLPLGQVHGNELEYMASNDFSALVNANPAVILFLTFIVVDTTGAGLAQGISSSLVLRFTCQFFNRNYLSA